MDVKQATNTCFACCVKATLQDMDRNEYIISKINMMKCESTKSQSQSKNNSIKKWS